MNNCTYTKGNNRNWDIIIKHKKKRTYKNEKHSKKTMASHKKPQLEKILQNKISRQIQYRINKLKNNYIENKMKKLDSKENTLWRNLNKFEKKTLHIQTLKVDDREITDMQKQLANNFENIYKGNDDFRDHDLERQVTDKITRLTETTPDEKHRRTEKTDKNNKAPGEEGIQGIELKQLVFIYLC